MSFNPQPVRPSRWGTQDEVIASNRLRFKRLRQRIGCFDPRAPEERDRVQTDAVAAKTPVRTRHKQGAGAGLMRFVADCWAARPTDGSIEPMALLTSSQRWGSPNCSENDVRRPAQ
jgi:hypothetical protein